MDKPCIPKAQADEIKGKLKAACEEIDSMTIPDPVAEKAKESGSMHGDPFFIVDEH